MMLLLLSYHWKHIGGLPVATKENVTLVPNEADRVNGRLVVMTGGTSKGTFADRLNVQVPLPSELATDPVSGVLKC